jgi:hypothetical protein
MQALSGTCFIICAGSLFANRMLHELVASYPSINAGQVISTGASEIQHVFKGEDLAAVLNAYMVGMKAVFAFSLATCALTVLIALIIPFQRLHDHTAEKKEDVELDPSV